MIGGNLDACDREFSAALADLAGDDFVAGANFLEAVAGADGGAEFDGGGFGQIAEVSGVDGAIEGDAGFVGAGGPGGDGLRGVFSLVVNFIEAAFALGAAAPVGVAAVGGDDEIAIWSDTGVDGEHRQRGDDVVSGDVAGGGFDELGAVEFSAGFAADDGIAAPGGGAEDWAGVDGVVEEQAAGGLMLGDVVEDAGLVDDVGEVPGVARGEAVVAAGLDVEQLVEGVAVGEPG